MSEQVLHKQDVLVNDDSAFTDAYAERLTQWRLQVIEIQPIWRRQAANARPTLQARLREWHKRFGLFAFVFMGWLGTSGILLNQSVSMGLDASRVDWQWLMGMYGLHAEAPKTGYRSGDIWLVPTLENTVLDGQPLDQAIPQPLGFVSAIQNGEKQLYVAASDRLVILNPEGGVVDQLTDYTLPVSSIRRVGLVNGSGGSQVAVQDLDVFMTRDGIGWQPLPVGASVTWSEASALPGPEQEKVLPFSRPSMPIEQVLIDAHSGRLFGRFGPWLINMVGFAALVLSISGIWMVMRANRRRRGRASTRS